MASYNAARLTFMPVFRPDEEPRLRELLDALERPVELVVALGPEETPLPGARDVDFSAETVRIVEGLTALSERVTSRIEQQPDGVILFPAVLVLPAGEDMGLRYFGTPYGYELASLVGAVLEAGRPAPSLTPESLERLAALDRDLAIDVFVTPT
jgi:alkyl hydroperoxide reductase subunit F